MSRLLSEALRYAEMGWHVFPQGAGSKHPRIPKSEGGRGYLDATADVDQVREWWTRWPDSNIGLSCEASGLVVLDVDGDEGLESVAFHPGPIPLTTMHGTARGAHLIYRVPQGKRARRSVTAADGWQGLDVKSNGCITLPPSMHPSGALYVAEVPAWKLEPQPAPDWMLEGDRPEPRPVRRASIDLGDAHGTRYGAAALRHLLDELAGAERGTRNAALFRVAVRCAELSAAGHLSETDVRRRLRMAAEVAWSGENAGREISAAIDSAFARGGAS